MGSATGSTPTPSSAPSSFQSTHSVGSATPACLTLLPRRHSFNPRTPWGVRRAYKQRFAFVISVSIHALRGECDHRLRRRPRRVKSFNPRTPWGVRLGMLSARPYHNAVSIHALRGECDRVPSRSDDDNTCFNPRTPWGVRQMRDKLKKAASDGFNPRTPWGVRPVDRPDGMMGLVFQSTHSVGSATTLYAVGRVGSVSFNPRTPWGVRHLVPRDIAKGKGVSIHALRGECDSTFFTNLSPTNKRFNPRTPWGVRHFFTFCQHYPKMFQSTHSVGSATLRRTRLSAYPARFNPRTPWGVRQSVRFKEPVQLSVSIHALRGECDYTATNRGRRRQRFQSTHSVGSATGVCAMLSIKRQKFQSTHSVGSATRRAERSLQAVACFNPRTPWGVRPSCCSPPMT